MSERIAVVGAGAVGGYLGAHIARDGRDVVLIDAWPEHVEAMRTRGLVIEGMTEAEGFTIKPRALHISDVQSLIKEKPIDVAIVAVKSYDTIWATQLISSYLSPAGYVVSAQNAINEERVAGVVGWGRTVGCMLLNGFAVDLYEPGRIRRTMVRVPGVAAIEVGEVHGRTTPRLGRLAEILGSSDTVHMTSNLWGVRWSKLCVNGMRNGVSAATGLGGNARDVHPIIRRVVVKLCGEAVRVGQALGYELEDIIGLAPDLYARASLGDEQAMATVIAAMDRWSTGGGRSNLQRPSMGQDIAKGRRTEIDAINGFVADKGDEIGVDAPTHRALATVVREIEAGRLKARPETLFHLA
ncbi:MAG TPA: 2-dehydropantoate 2-reductase [Hyphomicrobiaceae bacterium]|nr:2-dehydropantoate 2-reductase [Hyphomicrobiaceae bacterium]